MGRVFFLAMLVSFSFSPAAAQLDKKLPALDGLVRYGCAVKGPIQQVDHNDLAGRTRMVWSVTFWAEHKDLLTGKLSKDWKLLYAYRKKRIKGLKDCDKFMDRVVAAWALSKRRK